MPTVCGYVSGIVDMGSKWDPHASVDDERCSYCCGGGCWSRTYVRLNEPNRLSASASVTSISATAVLPAPRHYSQRSPPCTATSFTLLEQCQLYMVGQNSRANAVFFCVMKLNFSLSRYRLLRCIYTIWNSDLNELSFLTVDGLSYQTISDKVLSAWTKKLTPSECISVCCVAYM